MVVQVVQDGRKTELVLENPFQRVSHGVENKRVRTYAKGENPLKIVFPVPLNAEERPVLAANRAGAECTLDINFCQICTGPVLGDEADGVVDGHIVQTEFLAGDAVIDALTQRSRQVMDWA